MFSCQHDPFIPEVEVEMPHTEKQYIFLGHTYDHQRGNDKVDLRIEGLDLNSFDEIWLGGDVCSATTRERNTLTYLDQLFNLASNNTHWAVGNHDIRDGNAHWIAEFTNRPMHYTHHESDITRIIINSTIKDAVHDFDCEHIDGQIEMIKNVCDTINESSHMILLMHYVLWLDCEDGMYEKSAQNANASWLSLTCDRNNQFQHIIYPDLIEVQRRGIQVIVISGDSGQYGKKYEYTTADGIQFYMSGINNSFNMDNETLVEKYNTSTDSVLIFHHDLEKQELIGQFYELNDL